MCGINGFIDAGLSSEASDALIHKMLDTTHHRGPDARGVYQHQACRLGHNRLSIIDLSEGANQPFVQGELVLVFNGEIYNYIEIRQELQSLGHTFNTSSDTEVLLQSFVQWGPACVQRFMGMWAFAIYDKRDQSLFASRDRFGIKPFQYIHQSGAFYFSSEMKALKHGRHFSSKINQRQVALGLQLGMVSRAEETYWDAILNLPPAHNLTFKNGEVQVQRYWDIHEFGSDKRPFEEKAEEFKRLFEASIRLHLRSDVPLGTCLSGGLDSSSIASSVCQLNPDLKLNTFSIFYDQSGYDERKWMRAVVEANPGISPNYFSPQDDELLEHLDRFLLTQEVPIAGSSPFSQYFLMRLARDSGVKVTLDGQGADEYLMGYMHAFPRLIADHIRSWRWGGALREAKAHKRQSEMSSKMYKDLWVKSMASSLLPEPKLSELALRKALPWLPKAGAELDEPSHSSIRSRSHALHYSLTTFSTLPTLLHYADRNSMAFSIESRVPFLDHRLVEAGFRMQVEDHLQDGVTKRILRESMSGVLPKLIQDRKDKVAFKTPGDIRWLRGPLSHLLEPNEGLFDLLDKEKTKAQLTRFKSGDDRYGKLIWRIAMLNHWISKQ